MDVEAETQKTGVEVAEALLLDPEQQRRLRQYARARFGIPACDADDLIQETALHLLQTRDLVRRPKGFILVVFCARCSDYVERQVRRRKTDRIAAEEALSRRHETGDDPERLELSLALRDGMDRLSESCQRILHAYYVEGRSLKETAAAMQLSHRGIYTRIDRCLGRLRKCLQV